MWGTRVDYHKVLNLLQSCEKILKFVIICSDCAMMVGVSSCFQLNTIINPRYNGGSAKKATLSIVHIVSDKVIYDCDNRLMVRAIEK